MKKNLLYLIISAAALVIGCEKEPVMEQEPLKFNVEVTQLVYNSAKVKVTHNGSEDITWYSFLTTDIKKNDYDLFSEVYTQLITSENFADQLKKSTSRVFILEDLTAETNYKYVAFGIKENGELYDASIATVTFTTPANIYTLKETDVWDISYKRNSDDNLETISVKSKRSKGYFACEIVSAKEVEDWEKNNPDGLEMVENGIHMTTLKTGIEMYVIQTIYDIQTELTYGSAIEKIAHPNSETTPVVLEMDRLPKGEHYILAVGFSDSGQHSQEYSVKKITVAEDAVASEEYMSWCGRYRLTGKADITRGGVIYEDEEVSYEITIEKADNNFMYKVSGWECGEQIENKWDEEIVNLGFNAYYNDGKLEIREDPIGTISINDVNHTLGIYGYGYNKTVYGETPVFYEGRAMALAEPVKEGEDTTELKAQSFQYSYYDESMNVVTETTEYTKMGMIAVNMNNWTYQSKNPALKFPLTLKKIAEN